MLNSFKKLIFQPQPSRIVLLSVLSELVEEMLIVRGDFNFVLDPTVDSSKTTSDLSLATYRLLKKHHQVVVVWRIHHPTTKDYSIYSLVLDTYTWNYLALQLTPHPQKCIHLYQVWFMPNREAKDGTIHALNILNPTQSKTTHTCIYRFRRSLWLGLTGPSYVSLYNLLYRFWSTYAIMD